MITSRVLIEVDGMTCADCAGTVHDALHREPGVHAADVFWPQGVALIAFDPGVTDEAHILRAAIFSEPSGTHRFSARTTPRAHCC
ncbi:MAG: hypothetical protein EPO16_11965 [Dehalococcoidia bacterium]|nr:MAG: hypothetical protein EPO16_11965 [Dehalococcoidia bacterium]